MIVEPLIIFILGSIFGFFVAWKIAGGSMLRRVRNETITKAKSDYNHRTKKWL